MVPSAVRAQSTTGSCHRSKHVDVERVVVQRHHQPAGALRSPAAGLLMSARRARRDRCAPRRSRRPDAATPAFEAGSVPARCDRPGGRQAAQPAVHRSPRRGQTEPASSNSRRGSRRGPPRRWSCQFRCRCRSPRSRCSLRPSIGLHDERVEQRPHIVLVDIEGQRNPQPRGARRHGRRPDALDIEAARLQCGSRAASRAHCRRRYRARSASAIGLRQPRARARDA